jgi:hypothetical protein
MGQRWQRKWERDARTDGWLAQRPVHLRRPGPGEGTTDEMCIAFLRVTVDSERLGVRPPTR